MEIIYHQGSLSYYQTGQASKKKRFAATTLDPGHETFIVHVASL